ncbi:MAG: UDP-N-acetylmuramoyl-L-alanyl-D-glutamate--2,6-diaminopimelate ligase [Clostridia bacterium]|nr:UDP-N-acetylmuramoyl-L-alanyl-D-glutamate--2,6-diaminopimelate ligase [Clostridia bacterium]
MKLSELIKNIPHSGDGDIEIEKIEYNSLKSAEGDLFVCLPGAKRDGHDFAPGAYERGTRAFLVEHTVDLPADAVQIITPDTRAALATLAADFYGNPADKLHIIGITGTKGKTTTALLVSSILNAANKNCAYIGSNGVIINGRHIETVNTTPESLQLHHFFSMMVEEGVEYAVLEVSSQALMHNRVDGIPFEVTAYTNLSPDHIGEGEHADFEEYKNAKKRLFDRFCARAAVYNADDPYSEYMISGHTGERISFSLEGSADLSATEPRLYREETSLGISFDCRASTAEIPVRLMTPGTFSVYNGLCAMGICSCFGVSAEECAAALARTPVQGRFEIVEGTPGITFVIDYSHNGISLTKALLTLREYEPERLICVFGSVGGRTECRRKELAEAASQYADYSIITSDNPDFEDPDNVIRDIASFMGDAEYECITDRKEAIEKAVSIAKSGDIILFAGKGHETYQLICGEKVPFSERDIIEEAAAALALN